MTRWKMVPVDGTDEMWLAQRRFASGDMKWMVMLAAAPEWEPSDAQIERALLTYNRTDGHDDAAMRAAILAAVRGEP